MTSLQSFFFWIMAAFAVINLMVGSFNGFLLFGLVAALIIWE